MSEVHRRGCLCVQVRRGADGADFVASRADRDHPLERLHPFDHVPG